MNPNLPPVSAVQYVNRKPYLKTRTDIRSLKDAYVFAQNLMTMHVPGWKLKFDRNSKRGGACVYEVQTIVLNEKFCTRAPLEDLRELVLHEIAHALRGPGTGHDLYWKQILRGLGCNGDICTRVDVETPRFSDKQSAYDPTTILPTPK